MKTKILLILFSFCMLLVNSSCSDENRITNWLSDGQELEAGTLVPFEMEQNYPNPFNPSTVIRFNVAQNIFLKLEFFSEDWVKVATLVNENKNPGTYAITFDAKDLASGEYFYTMTGNGITKVMRMKLVK